MAKIIRFEDLQCCQKARQLANLIYDVTTRVEFAKDFRLCSQVRDAAGSVIRNFAEGFDAGTNTEFIQFLKIAQRSASEVRSQLYLALDRHYVHEAELASAYTLATETKRLINGPITYLRKPRSTT